MTEKATTKQKIIVLYSFKETAGDVTDNGEHATDLTDVLDRDEAEIVTITEELTEVKDDISALNSVKDEFVNSKHEGEHYSKCEDGNEEIVRLKDDEAKLHDENED